jgi:aconitate hydratase
VGDNITTDHIMPAGSKILPLRSNIPAISEFVFQAVDPTFPKRAKEAGGGFVLGGENYGQGSSREHAALAPMFLGVKGIWAKSFARIHRSNLVNFGILPMVFVTSADYDDVQPGDALEIPDLQTVIKADHPFPVKNVTSGKSYQATHSLSAREKEILLAGGLLNYTRSLMQKETEEKRAVKRAK